MLNGVPTLGKVREHRDMVIPTIAIIEDIDLGMDAGKCIRAYSDRACWSKCGVIG